MFNNFFPENSAVYEIMDGKNGTAGQASGDGLLRVCITSCFCTASMVTQNRLNVTFIRKFPVLLTVTTDIKRQYRVTNVNVRGNWTSDPPNLHEMR